MSYNKSRSFRTNLNKAEIKMPIKFPKLNELGLNERGLEIARKFGGKPLGEYLQETLKDTQVKIPQAKYFKPGILETDYRSQAAELLKDVNFEDGLLARACVIADEETGHAGDLGVGTVIDLLPTTEVSSPEEFLLYLDRITHLCKHGAPAKAKPQSGVFVFEYDHGNIKDYYQYEGGNPEKLIKNVGVLLAKSSGDCQGSIVEHPGEDGVYIVEFREEEGESTSHFIFKRDIDGGIQQFTRGPYSSEYFRTPTKLIQAYEEIKKSDLIPKDRSFHMEFSFDTRTDQFYANQLKIFRKKYIPSSDWKLNCKESFTIGPNSATTLDYAAFGITPKEGIEVELYPVNQSRHKYQFSNTEGNNIAYAYSDFFGFEHTHTRPHFNFKPKENIKAGIYTGSDAACIGHGGHWIIANSDLGLWQSRLREDPSDYHESELPIKVRIKSDGIRARIEKV